MDNFIAARSQMGMSLAFHIIFATIHTPGPVVVGVHVDYRDNHKLFEQVNERSVH